MSQEQETTDRIVATMSPADKARSLAVTSLP